jgi:hypothetical protein
MNAKETLKEIRTMLGFSDEETKVEDGNCHLDRWNGN